jgi:hypothetical protein
MVDRQSSGMPPDRQPIAIICAQCGGRDVSRDAWAGWDETEQRWELRSVFDDAFCHDCDEEAGLEETPLDPAHD